MLGPKLDRLVGAFEARGVPVAENLRSGVSEAQLDRLAGELGVVLPEPVRELYRWRDGHVDPEASNVLTFRDNVFLRLQDIPQVYGWVLDAYGSSDDDPDVDLAACVPIAEFMGAAYVVAGRRQTVSDRGPHPVLSVFHGVDLFFYSVESMVET
jgi:hypothetical protein